MVFCEIGLEFSFAAFVLLLLTNTFLHMRIKYGDIVLTHLTTWPYKIAFAFICFSIIQCAYLLM